MVKGYPLFKAAFAPFADSFLLVGGTACDLQLAGDRGFRATHDIDVLVVAEALSAPFADAFRRFLAEGGYRCYVSHDGVRHYYRFLAPRETDYPPMLELLSRSVLPEPAGRPFTPLPADGTARSMSAIVLDPVYYQFAVECRELVDGMPCLSKFGLIALKACAWLGGSRTTCGAFSRRSRRTIRNGPTSARRSPARRWSPTPRSPTFAVRSGFRLESAADERKRPSGDPTVFRFGVESDSALRHGTATGRNFDLLVKK